MLKTENTGKLYKSFHTAYYLSRTYTILSLDIDRVQETMRMASYGGNHMIKKKLQECDQNMVFFEGNVRIGLGCNAGARNAYADLTGKLVRSSTDVRNWLVNAN